MELTEHGLYLVDDAYFLRFPSSGWMWNKGQNRPHYFSFRDNKGITWFIPMSSKVDRYKKKIKREEAQRGKGKCLRCF